MDLVEKLASEGQLTPEQVERIGQNVRDFMGALDRDPSLRKEAMEKLAGWQSYVKQLPEGASFTQKTMAHAKDLAPFAAASAGLGMAMGLGSDAIRSVRKGVGDAYSKSVAYKAMLNENPELAKADPNVTQKAFNTIYRFNPHYAKDPLVAGTFVRNVVDQERMDIGTVSNLVQAHKFMNEAQSGGKGGLSYDFFRQAIPPHELPGKMDAAGGEDARRSADIRANEAKRQFFEGSEAVSADDPRVRS